MRNCFLLFVLIFILSSCTDKKSYDLYDEIELADSLYQNGDYEESMTVLNKVIDYDNSIEEPSGWKKLGWLISSDVYYSMSLLYYDYLFFYLAQLDALETLCSLERNPQKKISLMKHVFVISKDLENVIQEYINSIVQEDESKSGFTQRISSGSTNAFNIFRTRYEKYAERTHPKQRYFAIKNELPYYLYRRKWDLMNNLLIEMDKEYGYEKTYCFFDSILSNHGSCMNDYTKTLVKAYMSFSGTQKYEYDSGMNYADFKTISNNLDYWYVTVINNWVSYIYSANLAKIGFVVEYGNKIVTDPTLLKVDFYNDSSKVVTFDGVYTQSKESNFLYGMFYDNYYYVISKPLLCAILYHRDNSSLVPILLKSKQYFKNDTLVRDGYENGNHKIVCYDKAFNMVEWKLYDVNGNPKCDSTGTHCYRVYRSEDSTIEYYYNAHMQPRESEYAKEIYDRETHRLSYYDYLDTLIKEWSGDTCIYYKYYDSLYTRIAVIYETKNIIVVVDNNNYKNISPFLSARPYREKTLYYGYYISEEDRIYGVPLEIQRYNVDGSYFCGLEKWANEKFFYDSVGNITGHTYYDSKMQFQGGEKYNYSSQSTEIQYYDRLSRLVNTEIKPHN